MKSAAICLIAAGLLPLAAGQAQGQPHVHGVATLDIAVDAQKLTLTLDSPLDNLLGFEHEPGTDAEQMRAHAAIARLRAGGSLFLVDARAHCSFARVTLSSRALKLGSAAAVADGSGHDNLTAVYEFDCVDAGALATLDVGLFEVFSRVQRIEVQAATDKGQFKRSLQRPEARVDFAR